MDGLDDFDYDYNGYYCYTCLTILITLLMLVYRML
jgi:hypothetical protein